MQVLIMQTLTPWFSFMQLLPLSFSFSFGKNKLTFLPRGSRTDIIRVSRFKRDQYLPRTKVVNWAAFNQNLQKVFLELLLLNHIQIQFIQALLVLTTKFSNPYLLYCFPMGTISFVRPWENRLRVLCPQVFGSLKCGRMKFHQ